MKTEVRTITPETAKEMLKRNINNRPLKQSHVNFLSSQMESGLWQFDGSPIKLTEQGGVLDGQHRLSALVLSGCSFEFLIVSGISVDAFQVMDTGRNRQASDVLSIDGFENGESLQIVVRGIITYNRYGRIKGGGRTVSPITNREVLDFARENSSKLKRSIDFLSKHKSSLLPKTRVAIFHYLFSEKSVTEADLFINKFLTGLDMEKTSPIYVLREKLIADSGARTKIEVNKKLALVIKCWNIFRKGEQASIRMTLPESVTIKIM